MNRRDMLKKLTILPIVGVFSSQKIGKEDLYTLPRPLREMVHLFIGGFMVKINQDSYPVITQPEVFVDETLHRIRRAGFYGLLETSKPYTWNGHHSYSSDLAYSIDIPLRAIKPYYGDSSIHDAMEKVAQIAQQRLRDTISGKIALKYRTKESLICASEDFKRKYC